MNKITIITEVTCCMDCVFNYGMYCLLTFQGDTQKITVFENDHDHTTFPHWCPMKPKFDDEYVSD